MAYEFKKLSDVEVVAEPAESANVLIEENGVIKKTPKTAVGGGSSEWDAVIHFNGAKNLDSVSLVSGSYEGIKAKALANEMPKVIVTYEYEYGDMAYSPSIVTSITAYDNDSEIYLSWWEHRILYIISLFSDGSFGDFRFINTDATWTTVT